MDPFSTSGTWDFDEDGSPAGSVDWEEVTAQVAPAYSAEYIRETRSRCSFGSFESHFAFRIRTFSHYQIANLQDWSKPVTSDRRAFCTESESFILRILSILEVGILYCDQFALPIL